MAAYYNEIDPFVAAWLRNLIAAGLIAPGDVDERSIADVRPDDLRGYGQCHFFAGIGGWSYALRLAGWDDARPVWTGSCPCQPFSAAGKRQAGADERHLWPAWLRLIRKRRPYRVFGEQVAGAVGLGWLDRVFADLEDEGYACGAAVLGAHSVGAPHIRQRLFWVADAYRIGRDGSGPRRAGRNESADTSHACRLGDAASEQVGRGGQPWADGVWLRCLDGKARRVKPGIFPVADGVPAGMDGRGPVSRIGTLRGAGNAIVPQVAAEFIAAAAGWRP